MNKAGEKMIGCSALSLDELRRAYDWALSVCEKGQSRDRYAEGVLATLAWVLGENETSPDQ